MPINSTGPIALGSGSVGQSINLQLGKAIDATISMNDSDVRALAQKSVAGQTISFFDFYGKPITPSPTPAASSTPAVSPSRTPSATPAVTPSITPQPTPSRTPAVTPSSSAPPLPTYRLYNVTYCTGGTGQVLSSTLLQANSTTVYKVSGASTSNCFVVDSIDSFTTGTPTTYVATDPELGCFDSGCIQA